VVSGDGSGVGSDVLSFVGVYVGNDISQSDFQLQNDFDLCFSCLELCPPLPLHDFFPDLPFLLLLLPFLLLLLPFLLLLLPFLLLLSELPFLLLLPPPLPFLLLPLLLLSLRDLCFDPSDLFKTNSSFSFVPSL